MADLARAWLRLDGRYRHVYVLDQYEQATLGGGLVKMARVKLTSRSQETYDFEYEKLEDRRPRRIRR